MWADAIPTMRRGGAGVSGFLFPIARVPSHTSPVIPSPHHLASSTNKYGHKPTTGILPLPLPALPTALPTRSSNNRSTRNKHQARPRPRRRWPPGDSSVCPTKPRGISGINACRDGGIRQAGKPGGSDTLFFR